MPSAPSPVPVEQLSFDDLGTPLAEVTFVVVDLETTGGSPADAGITEIGAVKVRGGEVVGEFATLVNPGMAVPAFIAALTGITNAMLADAPSVDTATASFWEFAHGAVLVAHNAPYDISFLKGAQARSEREWPAPRVVDTVRIARRALTRDEVRSCSLATLAQHFRVTHRPTHRALDDARATVEVFHHLLDRVGSMHVHCLEDLLAFGGRTTPEQRRKRALADGLPDAPGVYVFADAQSRPLYVGTSRSLRTRVRSYFTAGEQRRRMSEMIALAASVTPIVCATDLEARVREIRLIAEHRPPYNRRSRHPEKAHWVALTIEPHPRLVAVPKLGPGHGAAIGPFASRTSALSAIEALTAAIPIRTCPGRLPRRPSRAAGCVRAQVGGCPAPCAHDGSAAEHAAAAQAMQTALAGDLRPVVGVLRQRMMEHAECGRFEDAARWRDHLEAILRGTARSAALDLLARTEQIVAARPREGGWDIHVVRYGRLAASGRAPAGTDPRPTLDALVATAEVVDPPTPPTPAALIEETTLLWGWLTEPPTRPVRTTAGLALPIGLCGRDLEAITVARDAVTTVRYDRPGRSLRPSA